MGFTYITHRDDNINSITRPQCVESLLTHGITDKTAYLSKPAKLCLFLLAVDHMQIYNTCIISCDDAIPLQATYGNRLTESSFKGNCG